jgi:hypothetical protein
LPTHLLVARLHADPTTERQDNLRVAQSWLERGVGEELGRLVLSNEGPLDETARLVLEWLRWC